MWRDWKIGKQRETCLPMLRSITTHEKICVIGNWSIQKHHRRSNMRNIVSSKASVILPSNEYYKLLLVVRTPVSTQFTWSELGSTVYALHTHQMFCANCTKITPKRTEASFSLFSIFPAFVPDVSQNRAALGGRMREKNVAAVQATRPKLPSYTVKGFWNFLKAFTATTISTPSWNPDWIFIVQLSQTMIIFYSHKYVLSHAWMFNLLGKNSY